MLYKSLIIRRYFVCFVKIFTTKVVKFSKIGIVNRKIWEVKDQGPRANISQKSRGLSEILD